MSLYSRIHKYGKSAFDVLTNEGIRNNILQAIPFWIASLLTGMIAIAYTRLFGYAEHVLQQVLHRAHWYVFLMTPFCFLIAWLLIKLAKGARGSGIPQVMAAIDISASRHDEKVNYLLSAKIIVVKIASSFFMVLGGGAIGREGPTIQIAGSVFRLVNRFIPRSWPKLSSKSFILTGAAAGLAAAFNTPLGGIVFAIEELARIHISLFRTALFTAVIISGLTAQAMLGPYLYLGYPDVAALPAFVYAGVIVSGIVAGLLGALTSKLILKIMHWKKNFRPAQNFMFVIAAGLLIAFIAYFINEDVLGSGRGLMNRVLFGAEKGVSWHTVLFRIVGNAVAFNTGAAGGVFSPSLAAGASVGAFLCNVFHVYGASANILILSGMVGFLTGVTRTPFTSAILVLEMTDRHSVIFHLMLAALVSNVAALIIDKHSLYEHLKRQYAEEVVSSADTKEQ